MNIEDNVISILSCGNCYTRTLYNKLGGSSGTGLSLNKFRKLLYTMDKDGKIKFSNVTHEDKYPIWSVMK